MATDWQLEGTILIACNCDYGCPCNFNAPPTYGHCEGGWAWKVDSGRYGDVDLAGSVFSLCADWPGAIHEGGGKAVAFVDDRAGEAQREALSQLLRGQAGGPWAIFGATYELDGPHPARHEIEIDGDRARLVVGDAVELETQPIRNPVSGNEVHPRMVLPEGLVTHDAALLASRVFRVADGISYDHSGKYAAVGSFDYRGP